jgi:hypothetical protein
MYDIARIEREMAKQFLSRAQLAKRAGVSAPAVNRIFETGRGNPETIGKLVVALNIDPDEVVVIKENIELPPADTEMAATSSAVREKAS